MGKMIGRAKEKDGLYHLEETTGQKKTENRLPLPFLSESSASNKDKIWLYHLRQDTCHLAFLKLFPFLFLFYLFTVIF